MSPSTPNTAPEAGAAAPPLHVAVAVLFNARGEVLLSRRPGHLHQGGLWEFPGGKVEPGESVPEALRREIREELGVTVGAATPLIRVPHRYPDRAVLLDVWRVRDFEGEPRGCEGQPVEWVAVDALRARDFPAANLAIVRALELPPYYLITPEPHPARLDTFLRGLEASLEAGIRLVQLRARELDAALLPGLAAEARALCHRFGARLLLNAAPGLAERVGADGVHLRAAYLARRLQRPLDASRLVGVSCHTLGELQAAARLGADFAMLSPVRATASHPGAQPLGWARFAERVDAAALPVYALGGLHRQDLVQAVAHGAQGVAAIRGLWRGGRE